MEECLLIDRIAAGDREACLQMDRILASEEDQTLQYLFEKADEVCQGSFGSAVQIRAIIEFSNHCRCACAYCGLQRQNRSVRRYRMSEEEILETVGDVAKAGYRTVILQSGEDLFYTKERMGEIIREIKARYHIALTLSCGERDYEDYRYWRECGADRYLIKHETSDETLYNRMHPHSTLKQRLQCQDWLRQLGYEMGSGFMIGLPGQTLRTLRDDILLLKRMGVTMAGIGPFIAHDETALRGSEGGSAQLTLKVLALARLVLPKVHLPSTTALNVKGGMRDALSCGANVIMQKATPPKYRALYDIYPGRDCKDQPLKQQRDELIENLRKLHKTGV
ncbi:[FeFe] hydrogenase H-cluster radical SAM maturase HydE [Candidatus Soleaferrea massiliensis]|uniref:[FeFe] hydrogenase H-cluster radical SAM maturase HydE n=1 Tax=Candidatus Soleaferrea massiliensis TaxID=1470354 RepID=UPI00058BB933|nr:[FeFe] hydrogenase H-cluster radical SAM maturase HydE [Candidatus Soleaferrea massiliensis]